MNKGPNKDSQAQNEWEGASYLRILIGFITSGLFRESQLWTQSICRKRIAGGKEIEGWTLG